MGKMVTKYSTDLVAYGEYLASYYIQLETFYILMLQLATYACHDMLKPRYSYYYVN